MQNVCILISKEDIYSVWCGNDKNEGPIPLSIEDTLEMCGNTEPEEFSVCPECALAVYNMMK